MKRISLLALVPVLLVGCASNSATSYSVTPDVSVTVRDSKKKAKSPYVQKQSLTPPVAGAAGGASR